MRRCTADTKPSSFGHDLVFIRLWACNWGDRLSTNVGANAL